MQEGRAGFEDDQIHPKSKQPLTVVAYYNTFGSPSGHIPERPFLQDAAKDSAMEVGLHLGKAWGEILKGKPVKVSLLRTSELLSKWITNVIHTNNYTPNKKSTLKKKEGTQPLVDTGHLGDNVRTWVANKSED